MLFAAISIAKTEKLCYNKKEEKEGILRIPSERNRMLKLLHAADLHLCSPLAAFSPRVAAARRKGQFSALEALLTQAVGAGAQMILLAGDVFDTPTPPEDGVARLFGMLGAQPVPVLVAPGNHDRLLAGGVWNRADIPQNVYVFDSAQLTCFDFPTLRTAVYGYGFTAESMQAPNLGTPADLLPDRVSVLLAHGDLLSPVSPYAPIGAGQLERSGFDYVALGHIHKPMPARRYGHTVAAYSGFLMGRGFDEVGQGQALLVVIEGTHVGVTPLLCGADRFEIMELDCEGATDGADIKARLQKRLTEAALPAGTALRVILTGQVGADLRTDVPTLQAMGREFALFEVRDRTVPVPNAAYLEKDPTLRGAFYRALLPKLTSGDAEARALAAEALRLGMAALLGREV